MKITWEEWVAEVTKSVDFSEWLTTREISKITGISEKRTRDLLRSGIEAGTIEFANVPKPNMVGSLCPTVCYRLRKKRK